MTQFQFDLINALIAKGAPAFSEELSEALIGLIQAHNAAQDEIAGLNTQLEKLRAHTEKLNARFEKLASDKAIAESKTEVKVESKTEAKVESKTEEPKKD